MEIVTNEQAFSICMGAPHADASALIGEQHSTLIDEIGSELMKRGTLGHDSIDWNLVLCNSCDVLKLQKHIQAFTGVCLAILRSAEEENIVLVLTLLDKFTSQYWATLAPEAKKFDRLKKSKMLDICTAVGKAIEQAPQFDDVAHIEQLLNLSIEQTRSIDVDTTSLVAAKKNLSNVVKHHPSDARLDAIHEGASGSGALDAKARAALRRDINAMAERIFAFQPEAAISYELRGYAAWLELNSLPDADGEGKTQAQAMPNAIAEEFVKAKSNPSERKLREIEERLSKSPDWLEGHKMSYEYAQSLGFELAAHAIRNRVFLRLKSQPALEALFYSNDAPIVSPEIRAWAKGGEYMSAPSDPATSSSAENGLNYHEALDALEAKAKQSHSSKALAQIRLEQAHLLIENDKKSIAESIIMNVKSSLDSETVRNWEPEMARECERLARLCKS